MFSFFFSLSFLFFFFLYSFQVTFYSERPLLFPSTPSPQAAPPLAVGCPVEALASRIRVKLAWLLVCRVELLCWDGHTATASLQFSSPARMRSGNRRPHSQGICCCYLALIFLCSISSHYAVTPCRAMWQHSNRYLKCSRASQLVRLKSIPYHDIIYFQYAQICQVRLGLKRHGPIAQQFLLAVRWVLCPPCVSCACRAGCLLRAWDPSVQSHGSQSSPGHHTSLPKRVKLGLQLQQPFDLVCTVADMVM